jgi:hypothetical protein
VNAVAVLLFLSGLLLAVRVMFFGVQRRVDEERFAHRAWPLALAALLAVSGAMLYARSTARVTAGWMGLVVLVGIAAAAGAWWLVRRSAAAPSTDPDDDPRYRFQGHVARITESITSRADGVPTGRIAFEVDGKRHEFRACWTPEGEGEGEGKGEGAEKGGWNRASVGLVDTEVVIERVEGEVAYVEPWTVVEQRL